MRALGEKMSLLAEKVVELGIDAGLGLAEAYLRDVKVRKRYIAIVEDVFKQTEGQFEKSTLEEEFDLEGIIDFLKRATTIAVVNKAITGTQSERKNAREELYNHSIYYSQARTNESKKAVRKMVSLILTALKKIERDNISYEGKIVMADLVDEIDNHIDEKIEPILKQLDTIIKHADKEADFQTARPKYPNSRSAMIANGGEEVADGGVLFNIDNINKEILGYCDESELQFMRDQLGTRLSGSETKDEIVTLFWAESKTTWQSGRRYEVMPMIKYLVRDVCKASIYVDDSNRVVDRVYMSHFYWENNDIFQLNGDRYIIRILLCDNNFKAISMEYRFGNLQDVNDRLFYFEKIKPIIEAKAIKVSGNGKENYNIQLKMNELGEEWNRNWELTKYWIAQMEKISEIETYYGIKFKLPIKATEDDYIAIEVLYNSIHRKTCRRIAGIPENAFEGIKLGDRICFDKEITKECPAYLENIQLFGYTFIPKDEYIIPCTLYLNDKKTYESLEGGVPVGTDFVLK